MKINNINTQKNMTIDTEYLHNYKWYEHLDFILYNEKA